MSHLTRLCIFCSNPIPHSRTPAHREPTTHYCPTCQLLRQEFCLDCGVRVANVPYHTCIFDRDPGLEVLAKESQALGKDIYCADCGVVVIMLPNHTCSVDDSANTSAASDEEYTFCPDCGVQIVGFPNHTCSLLMMALKIVLVQHSLTTAT